MFILLISTYFDARRIIRLIIRLIDILKQIYWEHGNIILDISNLKSMPKATLIKICIINSLIPIIWIIDI